MADLWAFLPDRQSAEVMAWRTDVRRANSAESRDSLRGTRRAFSYTYHAFGDYQALEAKWYANPAGDWLIPDWAAASKAGPVLSTDTVIAMDTDCAIGAQVMIWADCETYVIADVQSVGVGSVTLTAQVGQAFTDPTVAPVHTAKLLYGLQVSRLNGQWINVGATFDLVDEMTDEANLAEQYLGLDVLLCATSAVQALSGRAAMPVEVIDNLTGFVAVEPRRADPDVQYAVGLNWATRAEIWAAQQWLSKIRGRDAPFWIPAWGGALTLAEAAPIGSSSILVQPTFGPAADAVGRHLYLGTSQFREITSAADESGNVRLSFSGTLTAAAEHCKLLSLVRMASDRIELSHRRGFVSAALFPVLEVAA